MKISGSFNPESTFSEEEINRAKHIDEYLNNRFGRFNSKT